MGVEGFTGCIQNEVSKKEMALPSCEADAVPMNSSLSLSSSYGYDMNRNACCLSLTPSSTSLPCTICPNPLEVITDKERQKRHVRSTGPLRPAVTGSRETAPASF